MPSNSPRFERWTWIRSPLFLFSVASFSILSAIVALGATSSFDEGTSTMIKLLHDNSAMNMVMVSLSFLGDTSSLLFLAIVLTIIRRTRRVGMISLCSILIVVVLAMYIKIVVGRELPPSFSSSFQDRSQNQDIEPEAVPHSAKNLSYPSTHMAIAVCLAYLVRARLGTRHRILASGIWFYPILMALSRLYVLQYYVTDIAGGFLLGLIIAISMSNIIQVETSSK